MPILFDLGRMVITEGADEILAKYDAKIMAGFLVHHVSGNWTGLDPHDRRVNREQIAAGGRVLTQWDFPEGERIWIITEIWQNTTTILLPEEY